MRRNLRTSRAAMAALLCVFATLGVGARSRTPASPGAWTAFVPAIPRTPFRLGSAAQPFGWSTAIGDLNADGRPDYAVADRIGRGGTGFEYSLQFSVSGLAAQTVTFDSPDAALRITLRDVDHDQDLDLVVSTVLPSPTVRVWLNDGRGVFSESRAPAISVAWQASPTLADEGAAGRRADVEAAPRRGDDVVRLAAASVFQLAAVLEPGASLDARPAGRVVRRFSSRAPPAGHSPSL